MSRESMDSLIQSMDTRVNTVIEVKGCHTQF